MNEIAAFCWNPIERSFSYSFFDNNMKLRAQPKKISCRNLSEPQIATRLNHFLNRVSAEKQKGHKVFIGYKTLCQNGLSKRQKELHRPLANFIEQNLNSFIRHHRLQSSRLQTALKGRDLALFELALRKLQLMKAKHNKANLGQIMEVALHPTKATLHDKLKKLWKFCNNVNTWTLEDKQRYEKWLQQLKSQLSQKVGKSAMKTKAKKSSVKAKAKKTTVKRKLTAKSSSAKKKTVKARSLKKPVRKVVAKKKAPARKKVVAKKAAAKKKPVRKVAVSRRKPAKKAAAKRTLKKRVLKAKPRKVAKPKRAKTAVKRRALKANSRSRVKRAAPKRKAVRKIAVKSRSRSTRRVKVHSGRMGSMASVLH